ncbi:MAG: thioredoxin [Dehalococcoidia bacterium]
MSASAMDVTDATFNAEVIERSRTRPVVVDFWAPWCGPCRMLGPTIEQVASEYGDDVTLVKLNTDENPAVASQYRIQSIPAVKAFVGGEVAAEFIGAIPEPQIRQFFERIVPTPAQKAAREAERLRSSDPAEAERQFRAILVDSPGDIDATVGLASVLIERGEFEESNELLERLPQDARTKVLRHRAFLASFAHRHATEDLEGEARRGALDPRARYRWGVMLAARGQYEEALGELVESVRLDRTFADGAARKAVLAVFDIVGVTSPLARRYQQRLASVLF